MVSDQSPSRAARGIPRVPLGPLRGLQLIESVGDVEPFEIVPVVVRWGTAVSAEDRMAAKIRWAERVQYTILTRSVADAFAPYNAVIRISEQGTEDTERDYLAQLVFDHEVPV